MIPEMIDPKTGAAMGMKVGRERRLFQNEEYAAPPIAGSFDRNILLIGASVTAKVKKADDRPTGMMCLRESSCAIFA